MFQRLSDGYVDDLHNFGFLEQILRADVKYNEMVNAFFFLAVRLVSV